MLNTRTQIQSQINLYQTQLQNIIGDLRIASNNLDVLMAEYNDALARIQNDRDDINRLTGLLSNCREQSRTVTGSSSQTYVTSNNSSGPANFTNAGTFGGNTGGSVNAGGYGLGISAGLNGVQVGQSGNQYVISNGSIFNGSNVVATPNQGGFGSTALPYTTNHNITTSPTGIQVTVGPTQATTVVTNTVTSSQSSGTSGTGGLPVSITPPINQGNTNIISTVSGQNTGVNTGANTGSGSTIVNRTTTTITTTGGSGTQVPTLIAGGLLGTNTGSNSNSGSSTTTSYYSSSSSSGNSGSSSLPTMGSIGTTGAIGTLGGNLGGSLGGTGSNIFSSSSGTGFPTTTITNNPGGSTTTYYQSSSSGSNSPQNSNLIRVI